jgi:hypothetical protein
MYSLFMARFVLTFVAFCFVSTSSAIAQVHVTVPSPHFKVQEKILARVENLNRESITYCVEFGQTWTNGTEIEPTPSPFTVQQKTNGRWSTLLISPDVGSFRRPVVLEPGKSEEFSIRLNSGGETRLRLYYWAGSRPDLICSSPPKKVTSKPFVVK